MSNSDLLYCCMPLTPINRHQELQFKHRPLGEEYLPEALTIPPLPSTYLYPFIKLQVRDWTFVRLEFVQKNPSSNLRTGNNEAKECEWLDANFLLSICISYFYSIWIMNLMVDKPKLFITNEITFYYHSSISLLIHLLAFYVMTKLKFGNVFFEKY